MSEWDCRCTLAQVAQRRIRTSQKGEQSILSLLALRSIDQLGPGLVADTLACINKMHTPLCSVEILEVKCVESIAINTRYRHSPSIQFGDVKVAESSGFFLFQGGFLACDVAEAVVDGAAEADAAEAGAAEAAGGAVL